MKPSCSIRILVTGTRGKSSLVRLIHHGLISCGLKAYSRITGVLPRSLEPTRTRIISRTSPASYREILWWLSTIPSDAQAIVLENSAVSPELQPAAMNWLNPTLTVITNTRPDHQDSWGYSPSSARQAIMKGVSPDAPAISGEDTPDYLEGNISLAMKALELSGVNVACEVLVSLGPDIADFGIFGADDDLTACAFSANDTLSTEMLFASTGWACEHTTLLYHHRPDRRARLKVFTQWIAARNWRDVVFTSQGHSFFMRTLRIKSASDFVKWRKGRGRIFACGNVAGWPLEYMASCRL